MSPPEVKQLKIFLLRLGDLVRDDYLYSMDQLHKILTVSKYVKLMKGRHVTIIPPRNQHEAVLLDRAYEIAKFHLEN